MLESGEYCPVGSSVRVLVLLVFCARARKSLRNSASCGVEKAPLWLTSGDIRNQSAVRNIASWRMEKAPLWLTSGDIRNNQSAVRESKKTAL